MQLLHLNNSSNRKKTYVQEAMLQGKMLQKVQREEERLQPVSALLRCTWKKEAYKAEEKETKELLIF